MGKEEFEEEDLMQRSTTNFTYQHDKRWTLEWDAFVSVSEREERMVPLE